MVEAPRFIQNPNNINLIVGNPLYATLDILVIFKEDPDARTYINLIKINRLTLEQNILDLVRESESIEYCQIIENKLVIIINYMQESYLSTLSLNRFYDNVIKRLSDVFNKAEIIIGIK